MSKCKKCKSDFKPTQPLQIACSLPCAIELAKLKVEKQNNKKWKERKAVLKNKTKTYTQKVNDVKEIFQKWVRLRDKDLPCISCGATYSNPCWHGGHYKKAELYKGVIFDIRNCNKQCLQCNFFNDGNEANYRENLVLRIGLDKVNELEQYALETKRKKWSDEELQEIASEYKQKSKELENKPH